MNSGDGKMSLHERSVFDLLATRYGGDDWVLIPQVPNGTGGAKSRTADALAMSLWPSRGLELHGFEIKVQRGDWLKEVNGSGAKAHAIAKFCDRWWVIATHGVVKIDEVPVGWGLMLVNQAGSGITAKKPAPVQPAEPITRSFLAGLLRASDRHFAQINKPDGIEKQLHAKYNQGYAEGKKSAERRGVVDWQKEHNTLAKRILEFQAESGIMLDAYSDGKALGELVKKARLLEHHSLKSTADTIRRQVKSLLTVANELCPEAATEPA